MAAFEAEYGYPLDVPEDYTQFMDIAKFFTRPDEGLYGVAIYGQNGYDSMVMGVENTMFAWGAEWQDDNNNVEGVINSERAVEALEAYKELTDCCQPPGMAAAFFTETNDAFISGQSVMAMNFFAFFPALANPDVNPYAESTGFFANPAGPYGDRGAALGGQGITVVNYISDERKQASLDFIEWFAQEDIQLEWAELGGYTCNANVLEFRHFPERHPLQPGFRRDHDHRQGLSGTCRSTTRSCRPPTANLVAMLSKVRALLRKRWTASLPSTPRSCKRLGSFIRNVNPKH